MGNAAKTGAKWFSVCPTRGQRYQLGGNLRELADILSDPRSRRGLEQIVDAPVGSTKGLILAGQLARVAIQGILDAGGNANAPGKQ